MVKQPSAYPKPVMNHGFKLANPGKHPNSQKIQVLDLETEIKTEYPSIRQAAKALNCFQSVISANLISKKQTTLFR
jgi:hypothetical protein